MCGLVYCPESSSPFLFLGSPSGFPIFQGSYLIPWGHRFLPSFFFNGFFFFLLRAWRGHFHGLSVNFFGLVFFLFFGLSAFFRGSKVSDEEFLEASRQACLVAFLLPFPEEDQLFGRGALPFFLFFFVLDDCV